MAVATMLLLGATVLATVKSLVRQDQERQNYIDELHGAQQDVSTLNRTLDAIFENLPSMVFVKEAERLVYSRLNRQAEALVGRPRADLVGHSARELLSSELAEALERQDREAVESGQLLELPDVAVKTALGTLWLRVRKVPVPDENGKPMLLLAIVEDVTVSKRNEEELRRANQYLVVSKKELESFSYSVSHDLRAPLRSIDGFSQALLEDWGDRLDDNGRDSLTRIRAAAQRMGHLIDDLLQLARLTRAELKTKPLDLSELALSVGRSVAEANPTAKVSLTVQPGMTAQADPGLLRVVFENLLGNAWKFSSRRADPQVWVERVKSEPGFDSFVVRDNGAGFDATYASKLFGAFQRLHSSAEFEGTGIGLATVQRIILRHRGQVWADGVVNEGSCFYFSLPKAELTPP